MRVTSHKEVTVSGEFIEASRVFLRDDFLPKLTHCLEDMSEEDVWWRPNDQSNSVGNLILHLCGNLRQWILVGIGNSDFRRDRDAEFAARESIANQELIASVKGVVGEVDSLLQNLAHQRLLDRYTVQAYDTSCLQGIYHVVEHFSYHLGQILYIYKLRKGVDPGFYRHLSSQ
jgi:uncharacterized damage-inducible protein DinB